MVLTGTFFFLSHNSTVYYDHMNGHSELVIERVSKEDSGTYTCVAENIVGTIKSLGFVYVKGELKYLTFFRTNFILLLFIFLKVNLFLC